MRHPAVAVGPGVCYGASDVPLAPGWEDWCARLERLCAAVPGERRRWVSSPAARCRLPARRICAGAVVDARLREMDFGEWEGVRWDAVPRAEIDHWGARLLERAPPGGEPLAAVRERAAEFVAGLRGDDAGTVAAITHGGPIRCILADLLGLPAANLFRLQVDVGAVSAVRLDRGGDVLEFANRGLEAAVAGGPGGVDASARGA